MNNLLVDLDLARHADDDELAARLQDAPQANRAVLSVPLRRTHYERVHLQYEAIEAARSLLGLAGTRNDHLWDRRCTEFESTAVPGDGVVLEAK